MKRLINQRPGRVSTAALALLPFVALALFYVLASDARLAANPGDKLLPSFTTLAESFVRLATEPSQRTGEILFWQDTGASLRRLAQGVGISAAIGLILGVALGAIPLIRSGFAPFVAVLSLIPPMAVLPVLFIVFGLGEVSKVVLIVVGITPFIVRDLQQRVQELPRELIIKAQTLGANSWQIVLRVILPQVVPRLIDAVRLSLGTGLALPDLGRGDRGHRGARLSHLPGAPVSRDGRHPALRGLDHHPRLSDRLPAEADLAAGLPLVSHRRAGPMTPRIRFENVWMTYGDQVVLERLNLTVAPGEFCTIVGASGCGKTTLLRLLLGEETPSRGRILLDGEPFPPSRGRIAASSFSATRCFRICPSWATCCWDWSCVPRP